MTPTPAYKRLAHMLTPNANDMCAERSAAPVEPAPMRDIDGEVAAARLAGEIAGRASAEEECALRIKVAEQQVQEEVDRRAGDILKAFEAALERLRGDLEASIAQLLRSLVTRKLAEEAMEALSAELRTLIKGRSLTSITIRGSGNCLARLRSELIESGYEPELQESDEIDVSITIDNTVVETRIGACLKAIEGAL
ncbi:MAG: hypothetical protein JSS20_18245 [Proteobacteria bacterium]|nr:hypothetical protein [Pseudomonadota bacterium]